MKKHAYLIMAHNQWELLKKILIALDDPRNDIYLHIDSKVDSFPKAEIDNVCKYSKLFYTKRYDIHWGGSEMMECEITMLRMACQKDYCYYHLLSGVDFPIKSQDYIHAFFEKNDGKEFIGFDWDSIKTGRLRSRSQFYHFWTKQIARGNKDTLNFRLFQRLELTSIRIQKWLKIDRIKGETYYKGSQWFSITQGFARYIVSREKWLKSRYTFSLNADEAFLQNLIKNAQNNQFMIADNNLRYIKWIQGESSPVTLNMDYYDSLVKSDCIFARKFDWNLDNELIFKILDGIIRGSSDEF